MAPYSLWGIRFSDIYFVIKQIKTLNRDRVREGGRNLFLLFNELTCCVQGMMKMVGKRSHRMFLHIQKWNWEIGNRLSCVRGSTEHKALLCLPCQPYFPQHMHEHIHAFTLEILRFIQNQLHAEISNWSSSLRPALEYRFAHPAWSHPAASADSAWLNWGRVGWHLILKILLLEM